MRLLIVLVTVVACADRAKRDSTAGTDESAKADTGWTISARTAGSIQLGTPLAVAGSALGEQLQAAHDTLSGSCTYVRPRKLPAGASLMVVDDTVVRIDVDSGDVATVEGARVGDTETRLRTLYGQRLRVMPHKYTDGHYLIVSPPEPQDSAFRIVFETDGETVVKYRAGRLPAVEWVEGCS